MRYVIALAALLLAGPAGAVDWKMYGGAEGNKICFYDAAGIDRTPDGNLWIWSVCHVSKEPNASPDLMRG